jgi:hypothetical protein
MVLHALQTDHEPLITVCIPVSPIKSHPDTHVLEETLDSVRHHLPDAELVVTFDGVRKEQKDRRQDYAEFIRRALWLLDKKYGRALPLLFETHHHQSGMMREALQHVDTPLLMYVEADCPLVTDELIAWPAVTEFILSGESNLVRFAHEAMIHPEHVHMHHGTDHGTLFTRTSQWSQRPHIATTAFYRRLLDCYFSRDARCFLEDRLHGILDEAFKIDGIEGWHQFRTHLYTPDGNIKRSYTTDGRAGEAKYDASQIW